MITLAPVSSVLAATADQGGRAPQVIDVKDPAVTTYWAGRFNVTQDQLFTAIGEVGGSVAAVRRYLAK
ncbi:MAG: DUF3606 domain-containing protein [Xanthobacteraceae bacterium]|jgi:hypothetical protein